MDYKEKSFEFASDSSKLLITLATGIIAFLIAFLDKEAMMEPTTTSDKWIIIISWVLLLLSAISGVWTQLAMTDVLEPDPETVDENFDKSIRNRKIKFPFRIQIILFGMGIVTMIIYAVNKLLLM